MHQNSIKMYQNDDFCLWPLHIYYYTAAKCIKILSKKCFPKLPKSAPGALYIANPAWAPKWATKWATTFINF